MNRDSIGPATPRIKKMLSDHGSRVNVYCILIPECGLLYTWGWNKYGQLGHGDHDSRDVPTLLTLEQHGRTNCDVICGAWNTCVITREKATI